MNAPSAFARLRSALSGLELFSPRGLAARALLLVVLYAICEFAGLRENTTFLSGTHASASGAWNGTVVLGLVYLLAYYGLVLAAPILLIASALLMTWERIRHRA